MESIFDLPTHTLVVHAPVVLQPLLALTTVVVVARRRWRRRFGWWLVAALVVVLVSVLVAMASGEAFDELLDGLVDVSGHEALADTTRNLIALWLVALIALVVIERRGLRRASDNDAAVETPTADRGAVAQRLVVPVLAWTVAILAVLSTVWMVRTGHEGARVTWSGVVEQQRD
jgi:divalent metal cation (Fe/Co/Zn/Cd) transporter